ncbi:hypothetical protein DEU56DRAFT_410106 [Suillus clintonianus]|uniref:uncharacterized protein n=1 Tax=Suillus clintonianus TaxID=1904413 RepID=UPI001B8641DB|nr:uncharacterized protein DEU56DRAFT_410106 [Suillus clintonianus]KAG2134538.1 hypothetical protein DEU56DRAFT_410106 [Suillus clintonianus]
MTPAALPLLRMHAHFSNAFHRSSGTPSPISMEQPNSSNGQGGPSSLADLVLSKLLQYGTKRYVFLRVRFPLPSSVISCRPLFVARRPERDKAKRTQQQQTQSHGHTQASFSQTQPATNSTSAIPPSDPGTDTTTAVAAPAQSRSLPLWARLLLFLCCASLPHANGH